MEENNEIWKDIIGFSDYQVSNFGNVRSKDKIIIRSNNRNYIKKKQTLAKQKTAGYLRVSLTKNGKIIHKLVHRLVAETFIPNPDNLPQINHKDENKLNNCADNLEWCTAKYNCNYGERNNNIIQKRSKPILQYDLQNNFIKKWNSSSEIAKALGKTNGWHILECCNGAFKKVYGFKWRYESE